jgi:hypothetical protein
MMMTFQENASTKKRMAKEETSGVMNEMMNLRDQHMRLKMKFDMVQKQNEALWKVRTCRACTRLVCSW